MSQRFRYDIMLRGWNGTIRLVNDTKGCRWERVYHVITWCSEYVLEDAIKTCKNLIESKSRDVLEVWYEKHIIPS